MKNNLYLFTNIFALEKKYYNDCEASKKIFKEKVLMNRLTNSHRVISTPINNSHYKLQNNSLKEFLQGSNFDLIVFTDNYVSEEIENLAKERVQARNGKVKCLKS